MKRIWQDGIPTFAAAVTLLIAVILKVWTTAIGRLGYPIDTIFNIIFVNIAVLGTFLIGLPSKEQNERRLASLLGNLLVPLLAFPMNISIFGHEISWKAPLNDQWSWHICWLVCIVLQILFLTNLGAQMINRAQALLILLRRAATAVGREFSTVVKAIKTHDKGIIAIMTVTTAMWILVLSYKTYRAGTAEVLADIDTLVGSLLVWIACALIGSVVYTAPLIVHKVKQAVDLLPHWKILKTVLVVSVLMILFSAMPFLLQAVGLLATVLILPLCLGGLIIAIATWRMRRLKEKEKTGVKPVCVINPADMAVALLAFLVAPLTVLSVATALTPGGQQILGQEMSVKSCLDYVTACCNVASAVMQLFV